MNHLPTYLCPFFLWFDKVFSYVGVSILILIYYLSVKFIRKFSISNDWNFGFFRVKALKNFQDSGFYGQGLGNLTIIMPGWVGIIQKWSGQLLGTTEKFGSIQSTF